MREPVDYTQNNYGVQHVAETNKVLKNTYFLLSLTLAFSAAVAYYSMSINAPYPNIFVVLIGFYGLLFAIHKFKDSGVGLGLTFALTGFMGYTLGPILNMYLALPNGGELISSAFSMTAMIFAGLSAFALVTKKDFSFLNQFVMVGFFVLLGAMLVNIFMQLPMLQLLICSGFVLFSSAVILMQTSSIVNGGEDNYILATVTLYVSIYNLFLSLLQILGIFGGDD